MIFSYIFCIILQPTICNLIAIGGVTINLLLCLTVMQCFLRQDLFFVMATAAFFGLLYDLCLSPHIGATAIALFAVCLAVFFLKDSIRIENWLSVLLSVVLATTLYNVILWGVNRLMGSPWSFEYMLTLLPFYMLYNLTGIATFYFMFARAGKAHA